MFQFAAAAIALSIVAVPAAAQWRHERSGVTLPDTIGDLRRGAERQIAQDGSDTIIQYGTDDEPVTLYVYRASFPNPALWFDRTLAAMRTNVGSFDTPTPQPFTLGTGTAPNGLRAAFPVTGQRWKATAVAIAQHGEWLVKARATSSTLDAAGTARRLDALLGAVTFANVQRAALPLTDPAPCTAAASFSGKQKSSAELRAAGAVMGIVSFGSARGIGTGPAAEPAKWCRQALDGPMASAASLYRSLDGKAWTMLLGDAGMAASAYDFGDMRQQGAGVYFTRTGPAMLAETYDALPPAELGAGAALAVLAGQKPALVTVGSGPRPAR